MEIDDPSTCGLLGQISHSNDNMYAQLVMKIFDASSSHSYTAITCGQDEFENTYNSHIPNSKCNQIKNHAYCILNITNFSYLHDGNWAPIVYLQGGAGIHLAGFHRWFQDSGGGGGGGAVILMLFFLLQKVIKYCVLRFRFS